MPEYKSKNATFTKLYLDKTINSSGVVVDIGETTIDDTGYYNTDEAYKAMYERLGIGDNDSRYQFIKIGSTPVLMNKATGEILDYGGNKLNSPQQRQILAEGLGLDKDALLNKELYIIDGKAYIGNGDDRIEVTQEIKDIDDDKLKKSLAHTAPGVQVPHQFASVKEYVYNVLAKNNPITGNHSMTVPEFVGTATNIMNKDGSYAGGQDVSGDTTIQSIVSYAGQIGMGAGVNSSGPASLQTKQNKDAGNQDQPSDHGSTDEDR